MTDRQLRDKLDSEIAEAEASLAFWTEQISLQPTSSAVKEIVRTQEASLQGLQQARALFDA